MTALQTFAPVSSPDFEHRQDSSESLTINVASLIELRQQVKQAHWNVTGPSFIGLHLMFDRFAAELDHEIDVAAERQRALGFYVQGSISDVARIATVEDYPFELSEAKSVLMHLIGIYRQISASLRKSIGTTTDAGDYGTADMYTDSLRLLDQHLYLLTSHLGEFPA